MKFKLNQKIKYEDDVKYLRKILETVGILEATDFEIQEAYQDFSRKIAPCSWLYFSELDVGLAIQILEMRCKDEERYQEFYSQVERKNVIVDFVQYLLDKED